MKDRKPKFVYTFDNSKPTKKVQLKAICDLALLLFQIDKKTKKKIKSYNFRFGTTIVRIIKATKKSLFGSLEMVGMKRLELPRFRTSS